MIRDFLLMQASFSWSLADIVNLGLVFKSQKQILCFLNFSGATRKFDEVKFDNERMKFVKIKLKSCSPP